MVNFVIKAALIVGSGGLIFGYDIGVISTTISTMKNEIPMDALEEGLVVSIIGAGSIMGAVIGGPLCDWWGRWKTLQLQNFIFILGAIITASAYTLNTLLLGRFIVGSAAALSAIADVPYLSEIAPKEQRGMMTALYEINVSVGVLLAFFIGFLLSYSRDGWRTAYILPAFFAAIQSLLLMYLPDSPKWLHQKGKLKELREALEMIYGEEEFQQFLDQYVITLCD